METENRMQPPREEVIDRNRSACDSMPDFTRLRYFHGQMLGAQDFQNEQDYFREKLKLLNRCLQGYGTVCGLKVIAVTDDPDCKPLNNDAGLNDYEKQEARGEDKQPVESGYVTPIESGYIDPRRYRRQPLCVEIECGLALDCEGNELVVRHPLRFDLRRELSDAERLEVDTWLENQDDRVAGPRLYLSICFCVQPIDPVRPVLPDACSAVSECVYSKLRDSVKVKITTQEPHRNHCRDNCCDKCGDRCLLLAAIEVKKEHLVIHNDIRRWITVYEPVTITGINWYHGAGYTINEARGLLRQEGLRIEFSRPVLTESITDGVVDAWVMEGGSGRSGNIYNMAMKIILPTATVLTGNALPTTTTSFTVKRTSGETLQDGDRVLLIVRTDFILDECCRPVDGNHVGGRVPYVGTSVNDGGNGESARNRLRNGKPIEQHKCLTPPRRYGPWVSGNNSAGGTFESWFYIKDPDSYDERGATAE